MKFVKMLGLLAVAAAAMMAFVGTASATVTDGTGKAYTGEIHATSSNTTLHGSVTISCTESTVSGTISSGSTTGTISTLTFGKCGADTVQVLDEGTLSITSGGTVTSDGAEVTVTVHRSLLGFPVTTHCIYETENTDVGSLTEGANAEMHIGSADIPEQATDGACGDTSVWTGNYKVTKPSTLIVD